MKLYVALVLGVLFASTSWAAGVGAKVTHLEGELVLLKKGEERPVQVGDSAPAGTTVFLKAGKVAILKLDDGTSVKMKEGARFELSTDDASIELKDGAVFTQVQKKLALNDSKPKFRIKTASAIMGVRGTEFFTELIKGKNVWMCVHEGNVEVTRPEGEERVLVHAGEGILVEGEKKIEAPKAYEWTKKLNWNVDPKQGKVEDNSDLKGNYGNLLKQNYD